MMNPPHGSRSHPGEAADARCNQRQRDIVDDGIALIPVAGTLCALEYLKSHAVDPRIITRVLLEPGKRRTRLGLVAA